MQLNLSDNLSDNLLDKLSQKVRSHLHASIALKQQVAEFCAEEIVGAATLIAESFRAGGKLLLCGNGGSAADCQHLAAEFMNVLSKDFPRPALPAIALTTDTSYLTAYTNDFGVVGVFERQVQALGRSGDVLIGISTSGSSANVLKAVDAAIELGIGTIALTGQGGILPTKVKIAIQVPSKNTQYIQEAHLAIEHILCELVEQILFCQSLPSQP
jgi:D-sedoheptulose 7-phosphate isomerase